MMRRGPSQAAQAATRAAHAYAWQAARDKYPTEPVGDPLVVSEAMLAKYAPYYAACPAAQP